MQLTKKNLLKSHTGNERYARYNSCRGSVAVTMNNTVITVRKNDDNNNHELTVARQGNISHS